MVTISNHLLNRIRERTHLPKKAAISFLYRAIRDGINQKDIKDSGLRAYVESTVQKGYYGIVYCRFLIIMSEKDNVGVTILNIPNRYHKLIDSINFKNKGASKKYEKTNRYNYSGDDALEWTGDCRYLRQRDISWR